MCALAGVSYLATRERNPLTGRIEPVVFSPEQELSLGRRLLPVFLERFGRTGPRDPIQPIVHRIGQRIARAAADRFGDLAYLAAVVPGGPSLVLPVPGGPIIIAAAVVAVLHTEAEVAGVMAHALGHVVGHHVLSRLADTDEGLALVRATGVGTADAHVASDEALERLADEILEIRFSHQQELQVDRFAVGVLSVAGYDPAAIASAHEAIAAARLDHCLMHPITVWPQGHVAAAIRELHPQGVPERLTHGETLPR